jgi:hypothetical protein
MDEIEPLKKKLKLSAKIFIGMGIVGLILAHIGTYLTVEFWNTRFYLGPFIVGLSLIGAGVILLVIVIFCALPRGCVEKIPLPR